jgi:SAM-dependent methyltransferase
MDDVSPVADQDQADLAARAEHARRAASFGPAAPAYAEHRPDYPMAAIRWALEPVPLPSGRPVKILDLGAGTGKLTAQLAGLAIGAAPVSVVAVEPDPAMLAELHRQVQSGITAMAGRAEAIPLPDASVDAVLAGQAAHWFDLDRAMPEIARVLVPGGVFAGLWNADDDRVDWVAGLHKVSGKATTATVSASQASLGSSGRELFLPMERAGFSHTYARTADSLIETMRTHSMFLIMEPAEREAVLAMVRDYLAATPQTAGGQFGLPMYTIAVRTIRR